MENINETVINESENPNTITLDTPVLRGEQKIEKVTVAKPNAGTLRGYRWRRWHNLTSMR